LVSQGQLLVRINPSQNLGESLMELKKRNSTTAKFQSRSQGHIQSNPKKPSYSNSLNSKLQPCTFIQNNNESFSKSSQKSQNETWIWNGVSWIHKTVDVAQTSKESDKSISDAIQELDQLKKSMLSRLSDLQLNNTNIEITKEETKIPVLHCIETDTVSQSPKDAIHLSTKSIQSTNETMQTTQEKIQSPIDKTKEEAIDNEIVENSDDESQDTLEKQDSSFVILNEYHQDVVLFF
jgi:hypothetical protein